MRINRRNFLKGTAMAGAGLAMYEFGERRAWAYPTYPSPNLQLWQTNLRGVGPGNIPVADPDPFLAPVTNVTHYTIDMGEFPDTLYPGLSTKLWGYNPAYARGITPAGPQTPAHLGGIIVAQRGTPIQITFRNNLPSTHIIPVDTTIPGAEPSQAKNRTAVHLHGGYVPWISDGGPFDWWTPGGVHGASFLNNQVLRDSSNPALANEAEYYYPNDQSARLMWYHDHAFGITRINAYAGLASAYIIRDAFEINLKNQGLPEFIENAGYELPLIFQDKTFVDAATIGTLDPSWPGPMATGSLWYAHVYDTALFGKLGPAPLGLPPNPSCIPEYYGDTMLVNGTVYPQVNVEPRRYRLRMLNACNARFLNLQLYVADASANGITLDKKGVPLNLPALNAAAPNPTARPTSNFLVIGSEGGFLPQPCFVPSNLPFVGSLLLAPAERPDVIIDFSAHAGQSLILYNDAPAPYPGGTPLNDYFPGLANKNPINAVTPTGSGPNTRVIMRFNVGTTVTAPPDGPLTITRATDLTLGNDPLLVPPGVTTPPPGVPVRQLTLNEVFDGYGRLAQLLGTNVPLVAGGGFGRAYLDPATEAITLDPVTKQAVEVWQIANLTADTHPIHFHLVNVQIISRQKLAVGSYKGIPNVQGAPLPPAPEETGWKETVRMNPGELTTVIMQFRLPATPPGVVSYPTSPRFPGGHEYVWHCHILEHEEHDMMRPLVVY